jgi:hypothetical protein
VGLILGFLGYILPLLLNGRNNNGLPQTPTLAISPAVEPTPSITITNENTSIEKAMNSLSGRESRGQVQFKINCAASFRNEKLRKGEIGAPDIKSLINKLQYNLINPVPSKVYDTLLSQEGIYEIDCKY